MAQDEYKIVVKKDVVELKKLEKELDAQRKKELEAVKTSNKLILEEEKRKTKELEQQYKIELEQFKAVQKEKERIIKQTAKEELEAKRRLEAEKDPPGQLPKFKMGSLGDLKDQVARIKKMIITGLDIKGDELPASALQLLQDKLKKINPVVITFFI